MLLTLLICILLVMPAVSAQEVTVVENVVYEAIENEDQPRHIITLEQKKDIVREIINRPFEFSGIPDHITSQFKEEHIRKISADLYSALIEFFPESEYYEQSIRHLAMYHFENKDYPKAKQYLEKYLSLQGDSRKTIQMRFNLGVVYKELEMYKRAIKSFFQVIDTLGEHDLSYEAYLNIADCYQRQDNIKKLIMTYENVAGYFNDTRIIAGSLLKVSKIFIEQNNYFSAIWNLKRITERYNHSEHYYEALYILAGCYAKTGEIVLQRDILKELASDHSLDNRFVYRALYALADSYYSTEEYKEASIAYFTALKSEPRYKDALEARFKLAKSYLNLDVIDMAEATFEQLAGEKLPPQRKREVLFSLGKIYYINNSFEKSIESLKKITGDKEHDLLIRYYMAMSYYKLEEYRKSFEQFLYLEHQEADPVMKVNGIVMLGSILLALDKFDSATHYFDNSIEIIDNLTRVDKKESSDNNKSSVLSNDQVEQLNKLKIEALFALGRGYFKVKQFDKAAQIYQILMPLDILPADRAWVLYQIGKCYENSQDYEKAKLMYTELREKYPEYNVAEQAAWDLKNIEWNNRYSKIKNM
ncbi:MAG: tetratricopeptide repeat protein [Candidatus Auribacterota bacterium]|nr:tetratricopeptide repeat protein [Candidatus Auribacterota bacterium]